MVASALSCYEIIEVLDMFTFKIRIVIELLF
jgi:hypothetical protein